MVHDRTHSHGDLPFDPFMIKQRKPFWMYGLEELRCDLTAFREAVKLEARGRAAGPLTCSTPILFDRLFRFPVTGDRVRNYDGLGGQLLFAYLHQHDVAALDRQPAAASTGSAPPQVTNQLCAEIETLYRDGIDRSQARPLDRGATSWSPRYLAPHPGSTWAKGPDALPLTAAAGKARMVDDVLPDEFPLSMFYEALPRS